MKRHEQTNLGRFFGSRAFLLVALAAAVLTALGFARAYYQDYMVRQEIERLEREVKELEHKKLESMEILKYVSSPTFVEDKARTELNMKQPGENVLVVTDTKATSVPTELETSPERPPLNNPSKWWYYFTAHRLP